MSGLEYCPNNIHKYFFSPLQLFIVQLLMGEKKKNQIHVKDNFKSMCLNLKWCAMVVLTHHNYHFTSGLH